MKIKVVLILLLCLVNTFLAQEKVTLQDIISKYESLEYEDVISLAENLLKSVQLQQSEIIEVHTMKAISHYALSQESEAKNSFIEILKLDRNFNPDPVRVSPKIISFFNEVREEFLKTNIQPEQVQKSEKDSILVVDKSLVLNEKIQFKNLLLKSLIIPGWGHLSYDGSSTKGWILTTASIINIGALVYYIVDTGKKEKDYLNQSDEQQIKTLYDKYDKSYKVRNLLITSLAAIWIYAQADLLLFSFDEMNADVKLNLSGKSPSEIPLQFNLNIRF